MSTEIKVWKIMDDKTLKPIDDTTPAQEGRKEDEDLEKWIISDPSILGDDIVLIGEQASSKDSGRSDLIGVDVRGNILVVELKTGELTAREAFAQAIDYASDYANKEVEDFEEFFEKFKPKIGLDKSKSLIDYLKEEHEIDDEEEFPINKVQRILLVGTSIEDKLERMIEWLSESYNVPINAVLLKYIKKGDVELLARTMVLPEEVVEENIEKQIRKHHRIELSDDPGNYDDNELKEKLKNYLSRGSKSPKRIREILLPLILENKVVERQQIIEKLKENEGAIRRPGTILSTISREFSYKDKDFLRQIIKYEKSGQQKSNYQLEEKYRCLVKEVLGELERENQSKLL